MGNLRRPIRDPTLRRSKHARLLFINMLALQVDMIIHQEVSGKCTVRLLRANFGFRDLAFADIQQSKHAKTARCDGLPVEDGTFSIQIHPRSLPINLALTSRARLSAIKYLDAWGFPPVAPVSAHRSRSGVVLGWLANAASSSR